MGPPGGPAICYVVAVDSADPDLVGCDTPITTNEYPVGLAADEPRDLDNNFGFTDQLVFSLGDFVWYDTNRDGIQDPLEPGIQGVFVALYEAPDCSGASSSVVATNSSGGYTFSDLPAGDYCLRFNFPGAYTLSPADQGGDDVIDSDASPIVVSPNITSGEIQNIVLGPNDFDEDVGAYIPGSIGDTVWCDNVTPNNLFDPGEGVAGVLVELFDDNNCDSSADGVAIDMQSTIGDGQYLFTDLFVGPPGGPAICYVVQVDDTAVALGTCNNPFTPIDYAVALDGDNPDSDINDFGFSENAVFSLGDLIFEDLDRDGIQEAGEPGIDGILVTLYDAANCSGNILATNTSISGGDYGFANLTAGTYSVQFTVPAGWTVSPQGQGGDDALDSDANPASGCIDSVTLGPNDFDQDIGLYQVILSLGNRIWLDDGAGGGTASNGILDGSEAGIANVQVHLYDASGNLIDSQTSDGDGYYLFQDLAEGQYRVEVDASNFDTGVPGPLANLVSTFTAKPAPDNHGADGWDVGLDDIDPATNGISSNLVTLSESDEPTGEDTGSLGHGGLDQDSNLTLDFGFVSTAPPSCDVICDLDMDGDVDRLDLNLLFQGRGNVVVPPGAANSGDCKPNGLLSVDDVRACSAFCTLAGCAVTP